MIKINVHKCISCGSCCQSCPCQAITMVDNKPKVDEKKCISCGSCCQSCPLKLIKLKV